jgi:hypothetical protein
MYELTENIDSTFSNLQLYTLITICVTGILTISSGCYYSNKLVEPLKKLTNYTKGINSN